MSAFANQSASGASSILSSDAATATIYGPAASRTLDRYGESQFYQPSNSQYQQSLPYSDPSNVIGRNTGRHGGVPRPAFYNTREGEGIIQQARLDLSARAKPVDSTSHRNTLQDNRQRAYHGECVLPVSLARQPLDQEPQFEQYPLQEYNRFNLTARTWSGPSTHPRLKSVPYTAKNGPRHLDVPNRHNLVSNLKKNKSISNYDHNLPFLAKHTNNLVSC